MFTLRQAQDDIQDDGYLFCDSHSCSPLDKGRWEGFAIATHVPIFLFPYSFFLYIPNPNHTWSLPTLDLSISCAVLRRCIRWWCHSMLALSISASSSWVWVQVVESCLTRVTMRCDAQDENISCSSCVYHCIDVGHSLIRRSISIWSHHDSATYDHNTDFSMFCQAYCDMSWSLLAGTARRRNALLRIVSRRPSVLVVVPMISLPGNGSSKLLSNALAETIFILWIFSINTILSGPAGASESRCTISLAP